MSANADDPLLSVAGKISSGEPIDWKEITDRIETPDQAAVAEELRSLERFARITEAVPATWGRFLIIGEIGLGTFGTVYRAVDPTLQTEVALKVTRPRSPDSPVEQAKALEEARRLVKVKHPNVVRVYGVERIGSDIGLSMELVRGHTLDEIVRRQAPFAANEAALIGIDLCRALAAVHAAGILHGDIKAHNVMREHGGRTVLMDFGTSRWLHREPSGPGGDFAGTPLYLAPEVFAGSPRTTSSEIYSVGVLLYFLVTGSYPVEGATHTEIHRLHDRRGSSRRLRDARPDLPDSFIRVVDRALAAAPEERYESAGALEAALAQVLPAPAPPPVQRPPFMRTALVAAAALLVAAVASVTVYRLAGSSLSRLDGAESSVASIPAPGGLANIPREVASGVSEYRIDAAFYREKAGSVERLGPGATVAPEDALSFQVELSVPAYVYVVNEDERGESYLLFPLPGLSLTNPLPPGQRHRLPGMANGAPISWQVTSAGEREHFFIIVSPERSPAFEEMFATLPQPIPGKVEAARRLLNEQLEVIGRLGKPAPEQVRLRSVGGLTTSPAQGDLQLRLLKDFSAPLPATEELASGVWIRHAMFENPRR